MTPRIHKSPIPVLIVLVLIGVSASSKAYVLRAPHVLDRMTRKLAGAKTMQVAQRLIIHDTGSQNPAVEFSETLRYDFPETFRADTLSQSTRRIHVVSKGQALTVTDGKVSENAETRFDRYKDVLLYHSRRLLENRLDRFGVDLTVSSLGRFQGSIAFVLGAQYPDESRPQLWIEKDTFIPLRWVLTRKDPDNPTDTVEVRYIDWRQHDRAWYPMHIEFYQNGVLEREIRVDSIQVNPPFSDNLFDIRHLDSIHRSRAEPAEEKSKPEGLNDIEKTIEDFKKIYD